MHFLNAIKERVSRAADGYQSTTTGTPRSPDPPSSASHNYFEKKGEINEIKKLLKGLMEKGSFPNEELQEALKKVVSVMTVGIDLSAIFTEVLMFSYIPDIISKKMIYFFLTSYCENNEEIAMMAINTFLKDCASADGKVRGLALRTLCSLRVPAALEYAQQQVLRMLDDRDFYVRKIAVMGLLRLYYANNEFFESHGLLERLYGFLKDPHRQVVTGAISALEEIMLEEGGMAVNAKIILYLMNRFGDFDNQGKAQVCGLLLRYVPRNREEMFNIMNLLEDHLKKSNVPLKLLVVALFIRFARADPSMFEQVMGRVAPELISISCAAEDEQLYVVLHHILLLVRSPAKQFYTDAYRLFFCRGAELTYNAKLKIDILTEVASAKSVTEIIEEFSEYTSEADPAFAKAAVGGLTRLMLRFPDHQTIVMKRLLIFIKIGSLPLVNAILDALKHVTPYLRELSEELTAVFEAAVLENTDQTVLVSLMTILALIPDKVRNAPYLLEVVLNSLVDRERHYSRELFLSLLSSVVFVFLRRPGETFPVLTRLFQFFFEAEHPFSDDADVTEQVTFFYNALKNDIGSLKELAAARPVFQPPVYTKEEFLEVS